LAEEVGFNLAHYTDLFSAGDVVAGGFLSK
jgi:hypothetical protein